LSKLIQSGCGDHLVAAIRHHDGLPGVDGERVGGRGHVDLARPHGHPHAIGACLEAIAAGADQRDGCRGRGHLKPFIGGELAKANIDGSLGHTELSRLIVEVENIQLGRLVHPDGG
jgi:hypothetical protein